MEERDASIRHGHLAHSFTLATAPSLSLDIQQTQGSCFNSRISMLRSRQLRAIWVFSLFVAFFVVYYYRLSGSSSSSDERDAGLLLSESIPLLQDAYEMGKGRMEVSQSAAVPASVRWTKMPEQFPAENIARLPVGKPQRIPRIQHLFAQESEEARIDRHVKLKTIVTVFQRSWSAYKTKAWMHDELCPLSGTYKDPFNGWGAMLVDNLDTLWILDLKDDFSEAVSAVRNIDFKTTFRKEIPVFETTIRYLGGLLSAYDVSGHEHKVLLEKAIELAEVLMGAFDTPNRMPMLFFQWDSASASKPRRTRSVAVLAELGTLSLEFTRLAQLTGSAKFYDAVDRITDALQHWQSNTQLPGMWPVYINPSGCANVEGSDRRCEASDLSSSSFAANDTFTLGSKSDSLYEYLPKEFLLLGGREKKYQEMYEKAIAVAKKKLLFRPMTQDDDDILVSGSLVFPKSPQNREPKFIPHNSHLTCFVGGMFAMGAKIFERADDLSIAAKLTNGCIWAYESSTSGLMPEEILHIPCPESGACHWDEELWKSTVELHSAKKEIPGVAKLTKRFYNLRPEAIESVFYLYRITGDQYWRDKGWAMFQAIEAATRTEFGNANVDDVMVEHPPKIDHMQSFWNAETLKYFYLLFSREDLVSLDDYVLNTEAHPFLRPK